MRASAGPGGPRAGYTLVELAVVLAVASVAAALAYPSLAARARWRGVESSAFGIAQQLRLARWRAVVTGDRVRVSARQQADGAWRFPVERERGESWVPDGECLSLPAGVVVAVAGPAEKVFNPDGTCSVGSVTVRGGGGQAYKCTLAPATGRVRLYRGDREVGGGR